MDIRNLGYSCYFYSASQLTAAGQTDVAGSQFDMVAAFGGSFDCIMYICQLGTFAANGIATLKVQASNTSGSGFADLANTHQTAPAAQYVTNANSLLITDIFRVTNYRYVRPYLVLSAGSGNVQVLSIMGIAYNAHSLPITTQDATVIVPAAGGSGSQGSGAGVPVNVNAYAGLGTA
jgi:hypothetical protein